jgi:DNA-binding winged helix-turn-helix (wHTH) protein/predicted ATPase
MVLVFPPFRLDLGSDRLLRGEAEIALRPKSFAVLRYLAERPGRLVSGAELLRAVWPDVAVSEAMPRLCIREIRAALGDDARRPQYVVTRPRRGYRFVAAVNPTVGAAPEPARGVSAEAAAPGPAAADRLLVGRAAERDRLRAARDRAASGERQVVFVTGEPGIGKTTLVESLLAGPGSGQRTWVAVGQCVEPYGTGDPYFPLLEALERLARGGEAEAVRRALYRYAPAWLAQMSSLLEPSERESLTRSLAAPTVPGMLRELAALLEALAAERPLAVWLEDLHWADYPTLQAVAFLARRREPARLLLIGSYRPTELVAPDHPLARMKQELLLHGRADEIGLAPLAEPAVAEYLAGRLGDGRVAPDLTRHVHARTEGNPLFMVTVVDDLAARGAIRQADGIWSATGRWEVASDVPPTVRQLIERQVERLPGGDRDLLEAASVAGVEFSAAAVAAGLGEELDVTEGRCAALARQGRFLRPRGDGEWPDGTTASRFAFVHAVHQQVLYEATPAGRRRVWHGRIGARLEAGYGEAAREIATELAAHFERARDVPRAVRFFRLAGETALGRAAHAEAIAHLSRALALQGGRTGHATGARPELEILVALGPALIVARGYAAAEVEQTYQRALILCRQLGRPPELPRVIQGLWNVRLVRGDLAGAHALARELLARARRGRDVRLRARAHAALGETRFHLGELGSARQHLGQALALARRHAPTARRQQDPRVAAYASWGHWMAGFPDRARALAEDALTRASALGHPHNRAFALGFAGWLAQFCGDVALVAERAAEEIALCREHGIPYWLSWGVLLEGWVRTRRGQAAGGLAQMAEGLAAYRATGAEVGVTHFLVTLAEAHAEAGDVAAAGRFVEEALALSRRNGNAYLDPEAWRVRGQILARGAGGPAPRPAPRGVDTAAGSLRHALGLARRRGARALELRAATALARLWQAEGRGDAARRLLAPLCRWFREGADTADVRAARATLGALGPATSAARPAPAPGAPRRGRR